MRRATALSLSTGHFTSNFAHFVLLCQQWAALSTATQARAHQDTPTTMFTQRFNPSTGEYEWAVVDITDETAPADCNDALLAATTYTDMLNDAARNRAFHRAITRVVQPGVVLGELVHHTCIAFCVSTLMLCVSTLMHHIATR